MYILAVLAILFLTVDCQFDPNQQIVDLKKYEEIMLNELKEKEKHHRRKLSNDIDYINSTSILNIYEDCMIEDFSIKMKANKDATTPFIPISYKNTTIIYYQLEIKDANGNIVPLNNTYNCTIDDKNFIIINARLLSGYELSLQIKMKHALVNIDDNNFLYKKIAIYVPPRFDGAFCKYIFNVGSNSINIGLQNEQEKFTPLNSSAFFYEGNCPNSYIMDIIRTTPYQVTWNAYLEASMSITEDPTFAYLNIPILYTTGGTNFNFTKNEMLMSPLKNKDTFKSENGHYWYFINDFTDKERYFKINLIFSSSPVFWNVTLNKFENTSTPESIELAKTILLEDTSSKPDFYKLGKWVYNNIQYEIGYTGADLNISEIITLKKGVCQHFTELYNSLLNSIGIESIYTTGYSVKDINDPTNGRHAWTVAKINGKWIGLDATWNIFNEYGYLPLCHLFRSYGPSYIISAGTIEGKANFIKKEEVKLVETVNFSCKKPYLNINRQCKLCKEIDNTKPYYDFNTEQCVKKCTKVIFNSICYENCEQIDNKNKYIQKENNECEIDNQNNQNSYLKKINFISLLIYLLFLL